MVMDEHGFGPASSVVARIHSLPRMDLLERRAGSMRWVSHSCGVNVRSRERCTASTRSPRSRDTGAHDPSDVPTSSSSGSSQWTSDARPTPTDWITWSVSRSKMWMASVSPTARSESSGLMETARISPSPKFVLLVGDRVVSHPAAGVVVDESTIQHRDDPVVAGEPFWIVARDVRVAVTLDESSRIQLEEANDRCSCVHVCETPTV